MSKPGRIPRLAIRLTPEERRTLSEAAESDGLKLGPWLRWLGLTRAKGGLRWVVTDPLDAPAPRRVASRRKAP